MMEKTGQALGDRSSFFFGSTPQALEVLLVLPGQGPPALIPPKTNDAATRWTARESWLIHGFLRGAGGFIQAEAVNEVDTERDRATPTVDISRGVLQRSPSRYQQKQTPLEKSDTRNQKVSRLYVLDHAEQSLGKPRDFVDQRVIDVGT